jgi:alpha-amylase/alpha-mannosidase (GH57 family)
LDRYICIHGHFYQPPRENPWLEAIELQDSAYPYHDWNERISAECYAPNSASRILEPDGKIAEIVNNYSKISFNFGPTLLQWMEHATPDVYRAIQAADRESRERFSGHGSAMAQAYNHMIMPLANARDKYTQAFWGVKDFEYRFGRAPEGMWLPETAVDLESLDILAGLGIKFTVLSPYQASRVRTPDGEWTDVSGARVDPSTAYRVNLPSGRSIGVFFYDGPISQAVAFEKLLVKGEYLAGRLAGAFSDTREWPQVVHIATDGETYGHHHRGGDMGLAYALHYIEEQGIAKLTNYGEYLEKHPPVLEAEIFENTAWSCSHGVERWRSSCGCSTGGHAGWNQAWRGPLREALDFLRDALAPCYAELSARYLQDPWKARDEYISVILDRSPENRDKFFARHATRDLTRDERIKVLQLLELQRHAMLMYTSCGWFFDELSGIETVQVIEYAGRALQLANKLFGSGLEPRFLELLAKAKSNLPEHGDGRSIYQKFVQPAMIDLKEVAAHYAISSLFENFADQSRIFCYEVDREDQRSLAAGKARFVLGRARVTSQITRESQRVVFGVLHLGEHNISGGVRTYGEEDGYEDFAREMTEKFQAGDFSAMLHSVYENFDQGAYSLKLLFRDQQRRVIRRILDSSLNRAEASYRHIYDTDAPLMYFVKSLNMPLPNRFRMAADFVINTDLRRAFDSNNLDLEKIGLLLEEAERVGVSLDRATLEFSLRRTIERIARFLAGNPEALHLVQNLNSAVALARSLPFQVDLWTAQNVYHEIRANLSPAVEQRAANGDPEAVTWAGLFRTLGENLQFRTATA